MLLWWGRTKRKRRNAARAVENKEKTVNLLDADAKQGSDEPLKPMALPTRTRLSFRLVAPRRHLRAA